jgi:protein TonB
MLSPTLSNPPPHAATRQQRLATAAVLVALLAGCATPLPPAPPPPAPVEPPPPPVVVVPPPEIPPDPGSLSYAQTAREYRKDAAAHLYAANADRIYKGRMPPLLYAVGVLQVHLDPRGMVNQLQWMRAPVHAPEVIEEIERTVRRAAPYPVAVNLGQVTYTDTWLWHKSGRFQLDTLTEGQDGHIATPASTANPKSAARPASKPPARSAASRAGVPAKPGSPTRTARSTVVQP